MPIQQNFSIQVKKIYFKEYKNGKVGRKEGIIEKEIGRPMYIIKHPKWIVKRRHYNQLKKRYTSEPNYWREEPIKVIYDLFEVLIPQVAPEQKCSSKHKRQLSLTSDIDPKRNNTTFVKDKSRKREMCCVVMKALLTDTMNSSEKTISILYIFC